MRVDVMTASNRRHKDKIFTVKGEVDRKKLKLKFKISTEKKKLKVLFIFISFYLL